MFVGRRMLTRLVVVNDYDRDDDDDHGGSDGGGDDDGNGNAQTAQLSPASQLLRGIKQNSYPIAASFVCPASRKHRRVKESRACHTHASPSSSSSSSSSCLLRRALAAGVPLSCLASGSGDSETWRLAPEFSASSSDPSSPPTRARNSSSTSAMATIHSAEASQCACQARAGTNSSTYATKIALDGNGTRAIQRYNGDRMAIIWR